jgi:hypothetical protein
VDRGVLLARLQAAIQVTEDFWTRDRLHGIHRHFLVLADGEITLPVPFLRLAETLMAVEAIARPRSVPLQWGPLIGSVAKTARRSESDPYAPIVDEDTQAAALQELDGPTPRVRDVAKLVPEQVRSYLRPTRQSVIRSVVPAACFLVPYLILGLTGGIVGGFAAGAAALVWRRVKGRDNPSRGWWVAIAFLAIPAVAGVALHSPTAYFAPGIALVFLPGLVVIGSALVGRPLGGILAQYVWPQRLCVQCDRRYLRRIFVITVVAGLVPLAETFALLYVLLSSGPARFVVAQQLLLPVSLPVIIGVLWSLKLTASHGRQLGRNL